VNGPGEEVLFGGYVRVEDTVSSGRGVRRCTASSVAGGHRRLCVPVPAGNQRIRALTSPF
jgi:hypothetical protein